jgi:septum formation protein
MHRFDLIIGAMRLILASASPRRAELLRAAGFDFEVVTVDIDESPRDGEAPATYVRRLAAEKSAAAMSYVGSGFSRTIGEVGEVGAELARPKTTPEQATGRASSAPTPIILGADTAVVVDGDILGKPRDDADAERMLRRLSGRRHEVLTGISLRRGAYEIGRVETTAVDVAPLSDADVAWYVASGEGRDKAGAYAVQGLASRFIRRIEGSYANVVGLPVAAVFELMGEMSV